MSEEQADALLDLLKFIRDVEDKRPKDTDILTLVLSTLLYRNQGEITITREEAEAIPPGDVEVSINRDTNTITIGYSLFSTSSEVH